VTGPRNPVGTHVKVGPGLAKGTLRQARELGLEALQVFTGNPRGWALSEGRPSEDEAFREGCAADGIRVVVHAPYLVNLGSPTPATYERSVASVAHNVRRAVEIGAEGVVVHTGSYVAASGEAGLHEQALRRVREGLLPVLDSIADDTAPWLLLEPTAGQGRSLCAGVEDLAAYLDALDHHPKAGLCLDTCHAFAAGAPLDEPGGTTATVDRLVELGGPGRLRLVHLNDSADPRGSLRDRHAALGTGRMGLGMVEELLTHPATAGVPVILETPGSRDPGSEQIALVKRMRG
jgi:deoxyribonuclease IV